jgi:hypothetical protein
MNLWPTLKKAAIAYAKAKHRTTEQVNAFTESLWRQYELGKNEDLPRRRWKHEQEKLQRAEENGWQEEEVAK